MSIIIEENDSYITIRISSGVFIQEGVREFSEHIKQLKIEEKQRFLVDFSQCEYISSEGLGAMSDLWKYSQSTPNGKMVVLFEIDGFWRARLVPPINPTTIMI